MSSDTAPTTTTTTTTTPLQEEDEDEDQPWVDAWIRWPEDEGKGVKHPKKKTSPDDDEHEDTDDSDSDLPLDPFAPDPRQTFVFEDTLQYPSSNNNNNSTHDNLTHPIHVELQGFHDDSDQSWSSTGLTLWRASRHLCRYLVQHPKLLKNCQNICEVGAGLGLCGIVAHQVLVALQEHYEEQQQQQQQQDNSDDNNHNNTRATHQVVVTDGDTDALRHLRLNVQQNQQSTTTSSTNNPRKQVSNNNPPPRLEARQLLWGRDPTRAFLQKYNQQRQQQHSSTTSTTDDHEDDGPFQLLLASDVVYVDTILPPLFETVQLLLSQKGVFLFAYCARRQVPVTMEMVLEHAHQAGFVETLLQEDDGIFIYHFQWKNHKQEEN